METAIDGLPAALAVSLAYPSTRQTRPLKNLVGMDNPPSGQWLVPLSACPSSIASGHGKLRLARFA